MSACLILCCCVCVIVCVCLRTGMLSHVRGQEWRCYPLVIHHRHDTLSLALPYAEAMFYKRITRQRAPTGHPLPPCTTSMHIIVPHIRWSHIPLERYSLALIVLLWDYALNTFVSLILNWMINPWNQIWRNSSSQWYCGWCSCLTAKMFPVQVQTLTDVLTAWSLNVLAKHLWQEHGGLEHCHCYEC